MTDYMLSQLPVAVSAASGDYVPLLNVGDTTTPPAGPAGSDKRITVANLLANAGTAGGTMRQYVAPAVVALTFGTSVAVNAAAGNSFNLTLTASTGTIANPANPVDGEVIRFRISQDSTGSRTVAWGTAYDFGAATAPVLSTGAGKVDICAFEYVASIGKWCYLGTGLGY